MDRRTGQRDLLVEFVIIFLSHYSSFETFVFELGFNILHILFRVVASLFARHICFTKISSSKVLLW